MNNAERIALIKTRLTDAFEPTLLEIIDESHKHAGHAGAQSGAGHFVVKISSTALSSVKLIESHRKIYQLLDDLIPAEIHALSIKVLPT